MKRRITLPIGLAALALALLTAPGAPAAPFVRGDVDGNGPLEITDAVQIIGFLYLNDPVTLGCADAADVNDDSGLDISDAVYLLAALFLGGSQIPPPYPDCGVDPTDDALPCESATCETPCGGLVGQPCLTKGTFCELPPGGCCCDMQGVCTPLPDVCAKILDPVCGCDGQTYPNDCERQKAGVSKDHHGPCKEPE